MAKHLLVPFLLFYLYCPYPINSTQLSHKQFSLFKATDWFCFVNHKVFLDGEVPCISQCNSSQYINTSDFLGDSFLIITLVTPPSATGIAGNLTSGSEVFWQFKAKSSASDLHFSEALQIHYAENQPEFPISFYRLSNSAKLFSFCLKLSLHLINFIFIPQKMLLGI